MPDIGCCGSHECKDATLGRDEFTEVWSRMWLPGWSSGLKGSHVPDCWRLNEIFLCFPLSVLSGRLLLLAAFTGETLSRWTLELTSPGSSSTTHSCVEHIWTGKVVKIYGGNLISSKQTKDKSCLCSLNLNVSAEVNPVSSRIHHTPNKQIHSDILAMIYSWSKKWFI